MVTMTQEQVEPAESPASAMTFQLVALAVVNVVVLAVAWGVQASESRRGLPGLPASFVIPVIAIIFISALLCSLTALAEGAKAVIEESLDDPDAIERAKSEDDGFRLWWVKHRAPWLGAAVIVLSAVMVFALDRLVHFTGGGLRSPFMPLLEAPAVLGPFIARKWEGLILSVSAVSVAIGVEIQIGSANPTAADYSRTAHTLITLLVVLVAGLLSAAIKQRKSRRRMRTAEA